MNRTYTLCAVILIAGAAVFRTVEAVPRDGMGEGRDLFYLGLYQEIGLGELESAIGTYRKITDGPLRGSEIAGESLVRKGICFEKLGREAEANKCFSRAIADFSGVPFIKDKALAGKLRLGSQSVTDYVNGGLRRSEQGDLEGAREMFHKALLLEPDNHRIQLRMASVCGKLASIEKSPTRLEEAIRHYEYAVSSDQYVADLAVHRELAECYAKMGQTDEAIKLWQTYLRTKELGEPDRKMADFELELLRESSDYFQERDISRKLKDYLSKGEELTRNGDPLKAAKIYLQAKKDFPQSYIPPYRIAVLYDFFLKKPSAAIKYYNEALIMAPQITAQRARCKMAVLYHEAGDLDSSVMYIDLAISKDLRLVERPLEHKVRLIKSEKSYLDRIKREEEERESEREIREKKRREKIRERQILEQIRKPKNKRKAEKSK